ncbi:TRAP transporter small permease [Salipiger abyssi]|uniref:TRAP transporter small permease n=1 Tax=Salipiger abyssi TaxID=1250539 RepID=UPI0040597E65
MFRKFDAGVLLLTKAAVVALLFVMFGATLAGVFFRYVLDDALTWSEEVARYSMVWLSFLGGGLVFREGGHVAVDLLLAHLPSRRLRLAVTLLAQVLVMAVLAVVLWQGVILMARGQYMTTAALRLPMYVPYAALPVGAALMIYHLLVAGRGLIAADTDDADAPG